MSRKPGQSRRGRRALTLRPVFIRRETAPTAARIAPPSSSSAASRRGPIPATATRFSIPQGREVGLAGLGNRKDIRNAVEAAAKASAWGAATAHNRAQVLYYVAENLSARADEFARRLSVMTGASPRAARAEVDASIRRAFVYAGYADKFDGAVHATRSRFVTLAMNEPWGVMGIVCPGRGAAARVRLAGHAGDRHGQRGRCGPVGERIR